VQVPSDDGALEWRVTTNYLLTKILCIHPDRLSKGQSRQLGEVMRRLDWEGPLALRFNGPLNKGYRKKCE
jgi:hypothetical protein